MRTNDHRRIDCTHRERCGACSFLLDSYGSQLERKRRRLRDLLERTMRIGDDQLPPGLGSPEIEGYRNRAKMTVSTDRNGISALGYFQRRSRKVVDVPDCRVLVPELLETSRQLRHLLNSPLSFPFSLRHVDLRCGSDPTRQHLTAVLKAETMPRIPLEEIAAACPHVVGIGVNLNPRSTPQVIKGRVEPVLGVREVFVDVAGLALRVSPGSFFQVNLGLLPEIHRRMAEHLGEGDLLIDLYAGVGTHGLALRRQFLRVLCVEGVRASVADAKATIDAGRVANVEVVASPIHRSLRRLRQERPDAVILNPSAAGADDSALAAVAASTATKVAYLSCDPETLARDLSTLHRGGFRLSSAQLVDMMPQTRQIETLALLAR